MENTTYYVWFVSFQAKNVCHNLFQADLYYRPRHQELLKLFDVKQTFSEIQYKLVVTTTLETSRLSGKTLSINERIMFSKCWFMCILIRLLEMDPKFKRCRKGDRLLPGCNTFSQRLAFAIIGICFAILIMNYCGAVK